MKIKPVRYAVVGAGNIAQVAVLPAFAHARKTSTLAAIFSSDRTKQKALAKKYDVLTGSYDEFDTVAATGELDAVYLALPNSLHREWTERAARFGLHVLCEKPMALDEAECDAMIAATKAAKVKLMIAYRLHFDPITLRAIDLVRAGKIGTPRAFSSMFTHVVRGGDIRMRGDVGGGVLYDMGVYCINAARHLFGAEPIEVFAQRIDEHRSEGETVDDTVAASLRFANGGVAQFTCGQTTESVSSAEINGTEGHLRLLHAYDYSKPNALVLTRNGKDKKIKGTLHDQFAPELEHFSRCIREDREPGPSGREGLADVRIVRALLESIAINAPISLAPMREASRPSLQHADTKPAVEQTETVHAPAPSP